jgi:dihydroflavonol-4-reductase
VADRLPQAASTVFVTGASGFIGLAVVRRLVGRGDRVTAVVRDPERALDLVRLGVDIRQGDLSRTPAIVDAMRGADAAIHLAGAYRIGIAPAERREMLDANVGATHRVLDAAALAGLDRIVHISTVNVFGDTDGRIVDERYRRDLTDGFLSYYDETKFLAHRAVEERIKAGAPIVVAMPGVTYGPGDHTAIGDQLERAYRGTLRFIPVGSTGISAAHVEDVAAGIVAALDHGRIGEAYILAGENTRVRDALAVAARVGGQRPPRLELPEGLVRFGSRAPALLARAVGFPPNLREALDASMDVTYWASSAKAAAELGYHPRDLGSGVRAAFGPG